jgi:hypothetical protein
MINAELDREDDDLIPTTTIEKGLNHFILELTHELDYTGGEIQELFHSKKNSRLFFLENILKSLLFLFFKNMIIILFQETVFSRKSSKTFFLEKL